MPKRKVDGAALSLEQRVTEARATIAANIRGRREKLGLSQETLAEAAELSAIYLAAIEQARTTANPTLRALVAIATALETDLNSLTSPAALARRPAGRPPKVRPPAKAPSAATKRGPR